MPTQPSLLSKGLKAFSLFAIATGTLGVTLGLDEISSTSALKAAITTTTTTTTAPVPVALIDSQLRFLGSAWAGYGALLWWVSDDLQGRRTPLVLLGGALVLGGVGRVVSAWKHGFAAGWVKVATWVEFLGPLAVWLVQS